jgi:hypothetical protein
VIIVPFLASIVIHAAEVFTNTTAKVIEEIHPSAVFCLRLATFLTSPALWAYLREEELEDQLIPGTIVGDCAITRHHDALLKSTKARK